MTRSALALLASLALITIPGCADDEQTNRPTKPTSGTEGTGQVYGTEDTAREVGSDHHIALEGDHFAVGFGYAEELVGDAENLYTVVRDKGISTLVAIPRDGSRLRKIATGDFATSPLVLQGTDLYVTRWLSTGTVTYPALYRVSTSGDVAQLTRYQNETFRIGGVVAGNRSVFFGGNEAIYEAPFDGGAYQVAARLDVARPPLAMQDLPFTAFVADPDSFYAVRQDGVVARVAKGSRTPEVLLSHDALTKHFDDHLLSSGTFVRTSIAQSERFVSVLVTGKSLQDKDQDITVVYRCSRGAAKCESLAKGSFSSVAIMDDDVWTVRAGSRELTQIDASGTTNVKGVMPNQPSKLYVDPLKGAAYGIVSDGQHWVIDVPATK